MGRRAASTGKSLIVLKAVVLLWAAVLGARLIQLQILEHARYAERSAKQAVAKVTLAARRGSIYDRNGNVLALTAPVRAVYVNPRMISQPSVAAQILARVLELDRAPLESRLAAAVAGRRGSLLIQDGVSYQQAENLRKFRFNWLWIETKTPRLYPKGTLAAHILGGVDADQRGNFGLEQALDEELAGVPGLAEVIRDAAGRFIEEKVTRPPLDGAHITLTIDERIQQVAEEGLARAVAARGGATGSAVVLDPENGDILALASYPAYDPGQPVRNPKELELRMNQAVSVPFEPGSVFKVVTMAAALETTSLRPETVIPCGNGSINLYGRIIRDHHPYGLLSMADVLAKSSNVGTIQIALKVGARNLHEYVRRFGFGRKTGLPLPAESPGRVWDLKDWGKTSIGSVAIGHEISATTVQLAQAMAVFANGGRLVRPRLILSKRRPGQEAVPEPVARPVRVIQPETAITMRQMMEGVVLHGTGTEAKLAGYTAAGKTGSAQVWDPECRCYRHFYNSSFAGFAPVTRPALVVVVTINRAPVFGGVLAAPVFREITSNALRLMSVHRDLPDAPPPREDTPAAPRGPAIAELGPPGPLPPLPDPGAPLRAASLEVWGPSVPDFHGKTVRKVLEESAALGLPVEVLGSGVARAQVPPPGEILPRGERIRVLFTR
jgi:cell division protein FtsI (penicillin-binding protein 3)